MLVVFEVHLAPGADPDTILTPDQKRDTQAQMMTVTEARAVGFQGVPEGAGNVRLVAVAKRDAPWIHRTLETSDAVASFRMHEVD